MKAEIGIDEEGRAYVSLSGMTQTEANLISRLRAFLPAMTGAVWDDQLRITGDRLPGMGPSVKAQDATYEIAARELALQKNAELLELERTKAKR